MDLVTPIFWEYMANVEAKPGFYKSVYHPPCLSWIYCVLIYDNVLGFQDICVYVCVFVYV